MIPLPDRDFDTTEVSLPSRLLFARRFEALLTGGRR
jgi:hypothetical protein